MSNQVYSNFADRELYRASGSLDNQTIGPNQVVPNSLSDQNVGPFLTIPANANYSYDVSNGFLTFNTEGVYSIGLNTVWSMTNDDGGGAVSHFMDLNGASLPRFGFVSQRPVVGGAGNSLYSNVVFKLNVGDYIRFRCFANNGGTQTIIGSSGNPRSEYFVSKLS